MKSLCEMPNKKVDILNHAVGPTVVTLENTSKLLAGGKWHFQPERVIHKRNIGITIMEAHAPSLENCRF